MRKLNLPNKLTLLRIILVPCFVVFIMMDSIGGSQVIPRVLAAVLFFACAITDAFDGIIARKKNQITDFGKFLDPIADKFMIISAMMAFCASEAYSYMRFWVFIAGLLVVLRELAVTSVRLLMAGRNTVVAAAWPGKCKTVSQIVFVMTAIIEPLVFTNGYVLTYVTLAVMAVMTVYSGISYIEHYMPVLFNDD